jgi:pyruvate dehydrogenase E1 component
VLLRYAEASDGQILEEGITEAGSMASFTAAGTSYATVGQPTIPFFIFYSMFGFQRVGDLIWSFADSRGRGFLLGATYGRTTLNGEGLQHQDGHSLLVASTVPCCLAYDPAFHYETAIIVEEGLRRMFVEQEDIFYYITLYNENYEMPDMPEGVREGILRGMYRFLPFAGKAPLRALLLASGTAMQSALRARELLAERYGVDAEVWSVTSYSELRRDALACEREGRLQPEREAPIPYLRRCLEPSEALPIVAVSDSMRAVPDQIARWTPPHFVSLGTDGFGRSDTRETLRRFFEIDAQHIAFAVLHRLHQLGKLGMAELVAAREQLGIEAEAPDPAFAWKGARLPQPERPARTAS